MMHRLLARCATTAPRVASAASTWQGPSFLAAHVPGVIFRSCILSANTGDGPGSAGHASPWSGLAAAGFAAGAYLSLVPEDIKTRPRRGLTTCSPVQNDGGAGAANHATEAFDLRMINGEIEDPHTAQHYASGSEFAVGSASRLPSTSPRGRKRKKTDSEEGKDLEDLIHFVYDGEAKQFGSSASEEKYKSWMVDYYQWFRTKKRKPTEDDRAGRSLLDNELAKQYPGGSLPIPAALAVAPDVSMDLINEFRYYMFVEPVAEGSTKTRRKLSKVRV